MVWNRVIKSEKVQKYTIKRQVDRMTYLFWEKYIDNIHIDKDERNTEFHSIKWHFKFRVFVSSVFFYFSHSFSTFLFHTRSIPIQCIFIFKTKQYYWFRWIRLKIIKNIQQENKKKNIFAEWKIDNTVLSNSSANRDIRACVYRNRK